MFYAKIDNDGVCVGIQQTAAPIADPAYIQIDSFDLSYLGRTYVDGQWQ
jgi:hypothetical protein